jgi:ABC-type polysaccharide/polyol phosphate transport system ATPase subunit
MKIIEVKNVTKEYRLGQMKSFKQSLLGILSRLDGKEIKERSNLKALDDISFSVEPGEVLGIIGPNGAGKSTLLKLLARISQPTSGSIKVDGSVAPLIEVGAGLHPELTGRENIYLNASILGIPQYEIRKRFDKIVAFAELEEFIDTPVKRYSSGMSVRLGFSIATSVDADILIVDEVLAVGDLAFQRKCYDRMGDMIKKRGKTVLIVGHNIRQMERLCSRILLLDKGKVLMDGEPTTVCNSYYLKVLHKEARTDHEHSRSKISGQVDVGEIEVLDISLFDGDTTEPTDLFTMHRDIRIGIKFKTKNDLPAPEIIIGIHTPDFLYISMATTAMAQSCPDFGRGVHYFECHLADLMLKPGSYALRLGFFDQLNRLLWLAENLKNFRVGLADADLNKSTQAASYIGLVDLPFKWHFFDGIETEDSCLDQNQTGTIVKTSLYVQGKNESDISQ